jgi:mono/diheme cytochrome c family protein
MHPRGRTKILAVVLALVPSLWAQAPDHRLTAVTAVTGESWLNHLHRSFEETSMGKTGRLGPPDKESLGAAVELVSVYDKQSATVHGSDLYRWNCRACHGQSGLGAPPEINSVINPVRSSSAALVMQRMKNVGMDMSAAEAAKLARQSHDALVERLHKGGQDMPPFPHLSDEEIRSLIAYLKELADVPNAPAQQIAIKETPDRIGEHIVKSTCHVCHSAAGPNPGPRQLAEGAIPPLSTLTIRVNKAQFIQKVTLGAPIVMGNPALTCRGRMPVFDYLSDEEVADAYLYLARYAPSQVPVEQPAVALAVADPPPANPGPPQKIAEASLSGSRAPKQNGETADMEMLALLTVVGVLVSVLLGGALAFSIWECMRLSKKKARTAVWEEVDRPIANLPVKRLQDRLSA